MVSKLTCNKVSVFTCSLIGFWDQPRSQGFSLGNLERAGKDPGIGRSREPHTPENLGCRHKFEIEDNALIICFRFPQSAWNGSKTPQMSSVSLKAPLREFFIQWHIQHEKQSTDSTCACEISNLPNLESTKS